MKKILFTLFCLGFCLNLFCQFPAPTGFSVTVQYVDMDGMGWTDCGGLVIYAPAYCTRFTWAVPDTASTEAKLLYYKIYRDDDHVFSVPNNTSLAESGAYTGNFYVTAYYSDPDGESDTSNNVFITDELPIGINKTETDQNILLIYDKERHQVTLQNSTKTIERLSVIDMQGRYLLMKYINERFIETSGFTANTYIIEILFNDKSVVRKKIMIF